MSKFLRVFIGLMLFISTYSFADSSNKFYIKTGISLNKTSSQVVNVRDEYDSFDFDFKSKSYGSYTLGLGYEVNSFYNIEALFQYTPKINYKEREIEHETKVDHSALILNNIISIPELIDAKWPIKPYVGLGLGFVRYSIKIPYTEYSYTSTGYDYKEKYTRDSGTNFVWKATVGTVYPITKSIDLDLSYSYGDYGNLKAKEFSKEFELTKDFSYSLKAHELFLGLRYKF
ncbi:hypothetical protein AMYT_0402 [Malaciobacter mytili LMG 24559]|nr:outer membrane beta-barrel protein [Malaciobacter mytili]AXH14010.1 hypothetical protein AMYT_0402 [Malaciobacter mytili LMG 24559]